MPARTNLWRFRSGGGPRDSFAQLLFVFVFSLGDLKLVRFISSRAEDLAHELALAKLKHFFTSLGCTRD